MLFSRKSASNAAQAKTSAQPTIQILARRPMQNPTQKTDAARGTDALRETLPWPLPEGIQEQLAAASIRETVAWGQ